MLFTIIVLNYNSKYFACEFIRISKNNQLKMKSI